MFAEFFYYFDKEASRIRSSGIRSIWCSIPRIGGSPGGTSFGKMFAYSFKSLVTAGGKEEGMSSSGNKSLFANQSIANSSTSINLIQIRFGCNQTWPFQLNLIFVIGGRFGVLLFVPFKFICHNLIFTLSMLLILDLTSSSKFIF